MNDASGNGFEATDERPIAFTAAALSAVKTAISNEGEQGDGLRVSIVGGGCSGYQYNLDFEREVRAEDTVMELDGVRVYLDAVSAAYLKGTLIDFVDGEDGTGFKFNNPNTRRTCGCGSSCG